MEDFVLVGDAEVHVRRREVGEPARIGDVHLEDRRHLVWNAIHQLSERLGGRHDARHEVVELRGVGRYLAGGANRGDGIRVGLLHLVDDDAAQALQRDLHRVARQIDPLVHARRDADASQETLRVDRLVVIAIGDDEGHDQAWLLMRAQQRQVFGGAHLDRDRTQGVDDR